LLIRIVIVVVVGVVEVEVVVEVRHVVELVEDEDERRIGRRGVLVVSSVTGFCEKSSTTF
jgi:hypothetical protein